MGKSGGELGIAEREMRAVAVGTKSNNCVYLPGVLIGLIGLATTVTNTTTDHEYSRNKSPRMFKVALYS